MEQSRAGRAGRRGVGIGGGKAPQTRSWSGGGLRTLQPLLGRCFCLFGRFSPMQEGKALFSFATQQSEWRSIGRRKPRLPLQKKRGQPPGTPFILVGSTPAA